MQEKNFLSLRDILSLSETVSREEIDKFLGGEIGEDEEFICDLPEELIQLFCLSGRYLLSAHQIMENHYLLHEQGEVHSEEECESAHTQASEVSRQGKSISDIFWTLTRSYADVSTENIGIRKDGSLVEILGREEDEEGEGELFFMELASENEKLHGILTTLEKREEGYTVGDFLTAIFGEEPE